MLVSMLVLFLRRRFVTSQMPGDKSVGLDTTDSDVMFSINTRGKWYLAFKRFRKETILGKK